MNNRNFYNNNNNNNNNNTVAASSDLQQQQQQQQQQQFQSQIMNSFNTNNNTFNRYYYSFVPINTNNTMNVNENNSNPLRTFSSYSNNTVAIKPTPKNILCQPNSNYSYQFGCNATRTDKYHCNHYVHTNMNDDESYAFQSLVLVKHHRHHNNKTTGTGTAQDEVPVYDYPNMNNSSNEGNIDHTQNLSDSQQANIYNFAFHPVSATIDAGSASNDENGNSSAEGLGLDDANRDKLRANLNQVLTGALDLICEDEDNNINESFHEDDTLSTISEITKHNIEPNHIVVIPENHKNPVSNKDEDDDLDDDFTVNTALFDDNMSIEYNKSDYPIYTTSTSTTVGRNNNNNNNNHTVLTSLGIKRLKVYMEHSRITQKMLQDWDKKNGLPRSHSVTMFRTNRSRIQLLENRILPKWNGKPLIGNEPIPKKITKKKKKKNSNNNKKIKKKYNKKFEKN